MYAVFVVGDFFDGYASRKTNRTTELGKNLDMECDSLGTLIAVMLAIQYAQLPIWFLSVGVARYLFVFGIRWRERTGKPVLELPFSFNRRIIGGFMAGFLSVALLPLFSRRCFEVTFDLAFVFGLKEKTEFDVLPPVVKFEIVLARGPREIVYGAFAAATSVWSETTIYW